MWYSGYMQKPSVLYVIRHLNGKYVDLDSASGGYPYLVPEFRRAKMFDTFEAALGYKAVFDGNQFDSDAWRIVRCEVAEAIITLERYAEEKGASLVAEAQG